MDHRDFPKLIDSAPPGRITRKVRAFGPEIARLRCEGHTYESIRTFLSEAGVSVSRSTVHREAARVQAQRLTRSPLHNTPARPPPPRSEPPVVVVPIPRHAGLVQGSREFAEAFMKAHITNPLLRNRS